MARGHDPVDFMGRMVPMGHMKPISPVEPMGHKYPISPIEPMGDEIERATQIR